MKKAPNLLLLLAAILIMSCNKTTDSELVPSDIAFDNVEFRNSEGYPWQNHAPPFSFLFGNHIDTHQQTKVTENGQLQGFFYITFTGENTEDGVPIAKHGNCNKHPEACSVGWILHGVPVQATLQAHESGSHPTWCIDPDDMPNAPGYTHFHWLGSPEHAGDMSPGAVRDGYLLKLTARETFYFQHHGGYLVTPGIDYETHANVVTDCE